MSIYQKFCTELIGENGNLEKITLHYPDNFNFAYDVVDAYAAEQPDKKALLWTNDQGEEIQFTFADLKRESLFGVIPRMRNIFSPLAISKSTAIKWQMFWRMKELAAETW